MKKIPWQDQILMIPGPTPVSSQALLAAAQPMMNHRSSDFKKMMEEIESGLKQVFQTQSSVMVLTTSGTGAMEACIVNLLSPGDKILACPNGVFGERFIKIAKAYQANVEILESPLGQGVDPEKLKNRLKEDSKQEFKAILITHNETSTGVENNLKLLSSARGNHPALMVVDSVSALGASELKMDEWKLDAVASASQKALMAPPGLAFVAFSERAWEAAKSSKMPKFYFDLPMAREFQSKGETPFTPALPVLYALQVSLRSLMDEGLDSSFSRHKRMAELIQTSLGKMGLKLFAHPEYRSKTLTTIEIPAGVDVKKLREMMRNQYGIVIAGGQGSLTDKIFRIGHMGCVGEKELLYTISSLGKTLQELGFNANTQEALKPFEASSLASIHH